MWNVYLPSNSITVTLYKKEKSFKKLNGRHSMHEIINSVIETHMKIKHNLKYLSQ